VDVNEEFYIEELVGLLGGEISVESPVFEDPETQITAKSCKRVSAGTESGGKGK